jgi:hypothetical protein
MRLNGSRLEQQLAALREVTAPAAWWIQVMSRAAQRQPIFEDSGGAKLDEQ